MARQVNGANFLQASINAPAAPYTYACRFMLGSVTTDNQTIMSLDTGGTTQYTRCYYDVFSAGNYRLSMNVGGALTSTPLMNASTNVWYSLIVRIVDGFERWVYWGDHTGELGAGGGVQSNASATVSQATFGVLDFTPSPIQFMAAGGRICDGAVWESDLGADERDAFYRGFSPSRVAPDSLMYHWEMIGRASPEPERMQGASLTVGTTVAAPHAPVYRRHRARTLFAPVGAPPGDQASGTHTAPVHEMDGAGQFVADATGVQTAPMHTMDSAADFVAPQEATGVHTAPMHEQSSAAEFLVPQTAAGVHTAPMHSQAAFAQFVANATGIQTAPMHEQSGVALGPEDAFGTMTAPGHLMAGAAAFEGGNWVEQPSASGIWTEQ